MSRFVEVAVQLPVHGTFHYAVPAFAAAQALVGRRVLVPFGARGVTGLVVAEINQNESFNLEFTVTDGTATLVVDDDIFRYLDVEVDQCLNITGIMHYNTFDESQDGGLAPHITILPRSAGEVDTTTGCQ